jgi:hypothetical protein
MGGLRLESTKSGPKDENQSGGACTKTAELAKKLRAKTPIGKSNQRCFLVRKVL